MLKLKEKSIEWSLAHINKHNDTYVFPKPFEFDAINYQWTIVKKHLKSIDVLSYGVRPYRTEITPKSKVGFRICTQLDPIDSIIYNAVIYEISNDIEKKRVDKSLNKVFSFRLNPNSEGDLYDSNYNWDAFNKEAKRLSEEDKFKFVVVTDIADFYPSIYLHNIETHLKDCVRESGKITHANVLIKIIKAMHISQTHKGLPIGPQFSRPISELVLNQVDKILIDNKIMFIRYVDDYRIFCKTESEAYKYLSFLAQKCYNILNLKLNEHKTEILSKKDFIEEYLLSFKDNEKNRIISEFYDLCDKLGINTNSYDDDDFDRLSFEDKQELEHLNIMELLSAEIEKDKTNMGFLKFLLSNLARFDNTKIAEFILKDKIEKISPILKSFIGYLKRVRSFSEEQKHKIGKMVINQIDKNYIAELDFNRAWLLNLFTYNDEWNNKKWFNKLIKKYDDNTTKRELLLCLGRSRNCEYYRENKMENIQQYDPWVGRAFIAGISCLPKDERRAWYNSKKYLQRDFLDEVVEQWAQENPF